MRPFVRYAIFVLFLLANFSGYAQEKDSLLALSGDEPMVTIRQIDLSGNRRTRPGIMLREIPLTVGKSYPMPVILQKLQQARQNLMNTALFVEVKTDFRNWFRDSLDIAVNVSERWYFFPLPVFVPIDRNWNVWITQYKVSLDRINYGVRFRGQNITGNNDKLSLFLIGGYTRQYAMKYENPFLSRNLKHGATFEFSYSRNREINYSTRSNQQVFFRDETAFARSRLITGLGYSYRNGSIERHNVKLNYYREWIADTVAAMNPKFFGEGKTRMSFPELQYKYQYLGVDYIPYPLTGFKAEVNFIKRGFGANDPMNLWMLNVEGGKFWPLPYAFNIAVQAEATVKLPFRQPFYNQQLLGYSDNYLRGLEYYVIDGVAGGIMKATLRKKVADFRLNTGSRSKTYGKIPFRIYAKAYGDIGYAYNKENLTGNHLTNKFLYTGGVGVDIVTIYDMVLRLEYSFNQLRERALFIHMNDF